jgi:hypothetical protein
MKKETARTLMIVAGVVIFIVILGLATAGWLFITAVESTSADERTAAQTFDEVRRRFNNAKPLLEIHDEHTAVLTRQPPDVAPARPLSSLHVLAYDPDDEGLTRVTLPFWLLRLKSGPIELANNTPVLGERRIELTIAQLERYGPVLLIDHMGHGGDRVLLWTE